MTHESQPSVAAATVVTAAVIAAPTIVGGGGGGILLTHVALGFREHKVRIERYADGRHHKAHVAEGARHL